MKIAALEAYKLFHSLKLHFSRNSFDFFTSGGRIKISEKAFLAKRDRFAFYRLAKKYDRDQMIAITLANILKNNSLWSMNLLEPEAEDNLVEYQKRLESITYNFKQDLKKILDWCNERNFFVDRIIDPGDSYPPLLNMVMQNEISMETLVIMNGIVNFLPMWKRKIKEEIIWPKFAIKCEKYTPFVMQRIDLENMRKILKSEFFP